MEPDKYTPAQIAEPAKTRAWELVGLYFYHHRRVHEALSILWGLYQQLLKGQKIVGRIHKGTPLVWISDCFGMLGFLVHAKRYLMLTLCEDALREKGTISPNTTGAYFRLVWRQGLQHAELQRYAGQFLTLAEQMPKYALFPEALLQHVVD